jgi:ribosomal-protein-alanine N-acetyltransferase
MFPELSTKRLLLQQILPEDQPFIFKGLSHPNVIPYYGVQYKTLEETRVQMVYYGQLWRNGTGAWWKITDNKTADKLGAIGYNNYNAQHNKCEIGYWLLPQYWGRGIASEALQRLLGYLFDRIGLHRIEALVEVENLASGNVARNAGFTLEGVLRDYERKDDRYISLQVYSLLQPEWKKPVS